MDQASKLTSLPALLGELRNKYDYAIWLDEEEKQELAGLLWALELAIESLDRIAHATVLNNEYIQKENKLDARECLAKLPSALKGEGET